MPQDTQKTPSSSLPRPVWCISRGPGVNVPLVAVDELPVGVDICGVPRFLDETEAKHMMWLGELRPTGTFYALETHREQPSGTAQQTLENLSISDSGRQSLKPSETHQLASKDAAQITNHLESNAAAGESSSSSPGVKKAIPPSRLVTPTRRPLPPSGIEPDQSKKVYCNYWIRTGECDYMQVGCFYKHTMPDIRTLNKIGFRHTPKWWLDKREAERLAASQAIRAGTNVPNGPRQAEARRTRGKHSAPTGGGRISAKQAQTRGMQSVLSRRERAAVSRGEYTPAGQAKAISHISPPAVVAAARPQQNNAKQGTDNTAVDEPLIALDFPALVPKSDSCAVTSTSSEVSSASSSPSSGQHVPNGTKMPEPVHRFTSTSSDLSPARLVLEETNARMAREAKEAARDRKSRLVSNGAGYVRDKSPDDQTKDAKTTSASDNGANLPGARSAARRRGRRGVRKDFNAGSGLPY